MKRGSLSIFVYLSKKFKIPDYDVYLSMRGREALPLLGLLIDGIIDGIIDSIPENMAFISSMITMASLWAPIFYARFQKPPMP